MSRNYEFEYNGTVSFNDVLEVEDMYNVALEAIDEDGLYYYLIIISDTGQYQKLEYGPISIDNEVVSSTYTVSFLRDDVIAKDIDFAIRRFLSAKKRSKEIKRIHANNKAKSAKVVDAHTIDFNEALTKSVNTFAYFKTLIGGKDEESDN